MILHCFERGLPFRFHPVLSGGMLAVCLSLFLLPYAQTTARAANGLPVVEIRITDRPGATEYYAANQLAEALRKGPTQSVWLHKIGQSKQTLPNPEPPDLRILMASSPEALQSLAPEMGRLSALAHPESYVMSLQIVSDRPTLALLGSDETGLLWSVRDLVHFELPHLWSELLSKHVRPFSRRSVPKIDRRGFWSWGNTEAIPDPYTYIDNASQWKINTVVLWHKRVPRVVSDLSDVTIKNIQAESEADPSDGPVYAQALIDYAHIRGVKIIWGFSWGWDYNNMEPERHARLEAMLQEQSARKKAKLRLLCPSEKESQEFIKEWVVDTFEREYAGLKGLDGIYFQTFTEEAKCPCDLCRDKTRGQIYVEMINPIIQALLAKHPGLTISCGVHNNTPKDKNGQYSEYLALKDLDKRTNILWEGGTYWCHEPGVRYLPELARQLGSLRGPEEDYGGLLRIFGGWWDIPGDKTAPQSVRIDDKWQGLLHDTGPYSQSPTGGFGPVDGKYFQNPNLKGFLQWSRIMADCPAKTKGLYALLEASGWDARVRSVPALFAELAWDPTLSEAALEAKATRIFQMYPE